MTFRVGAVSVASAFGTLMLASAAWPPPALIAEALGSLASLDDSLQANNLDLIVTRDLARCAWIALTVPASPNVTAATRYLSILFGSQLSDGQFPWLLSETTLTDPNAINFVAFPLAAVWLRFGALLGPTITTRYAANISAAATALVAHVVAVSYTNIFTMRLVAEIMLGAALQNATLSAQGSADWDRWSVAVSGGGIHEYDSPTYSQTTLDNLVTAAVVLEGIDPTMAASLRSAADYVSTTLLANYVPDAGGSLGGAHSRDYDFLFGDGAVGHFFTLANATGAPPASLSNQSEGIYDTIAVLLGWPAAPPSSFANASIGAPVRVVQQTFCTASQLGPNGTCAQQPGADKYSYMLGGGTALGTSSAYYGPQDKQVVGLLPPPPGPRANPKLAQVCRAESLRAPLAHSNCVLLTGDPGVRSV